MVSNAASGREHHRSLPLIPLLPPFRHRLHLDRDLDVVPDQEAAGLQRLIPGEPEVAPIDLGGCAEADSLAAPGILASSLIDGIQSHLAGRAMNGQIAGDPELVSRILGRALNPLTPEADRRKL